MKLVIAAFFAIFAGANVFSFNFGCNCNKFCFSGFHPRTISENWESHQALFWEGWNWLREGKVFWVQRCIRWLRINSMLHEVLLWAIRWSSYKLRLRILYLVVAWDRNITKTLPFDLISLWTKSKYCCFKFADFFYCRILECWWWMAKGACLAKAEHG